LVFSHHVRQVNLLQPGHIPHLAQQAQGVCFEPLPFFFVTQLHVKPDHEKVSGHRFGEPGQLAALAAAPVSRHQCLKWARRGFQLIGQPVPRAAFTLDEVALQGLAPQSFSGVKGIVDRGPEVV